MATYVNDLRLKEISTGDESGTWGTSTNTNLELIGEAFSFGTEAITTNADTHTTTIADGSTDPGRSMFLKYTGTLDSTCTITIGPNTVSKLWFIENATSGSQDIIIKQGSGATVTVPNGNVKAIYSDGAGSGGAMVDAFTDLHVGGSFFVTTSDQDAGITIECTNGGASAGPSLKLDRNSASAADDDAIGEIEFNGRNDASQAVRYARITSTILDASDGTEDGSINLTAILAGTSRSRFFSNSTEIVINESSQDLDFRVESNGNANMLFVDGENDKVLIGTNTPVTAYTTAGFQVSGTTNAPSTISIGRFSNNANAPVLSFIKSRDASIGGNTILASGDNLGSILFHGNDGVDSVTSAARILGEVDGTPASNDMPGRLVFSTTPDGSTSLSEAMRINEEGDLLINTTTDYGGKVNIARGDNSTQLALVSTDADASVGPRLDMIRDSSSPAAADSIGAIRFMGDDSGGTLISYVNFQGILEDPTDGSEDGSFKIETRVNSSLKERITMNSTEVVINEESADLDFRVESNGDTHCLFVNGGTNKVGIKTSSPDGQLHIHTASAGTVTASGGGDELVLENSSTVGMSFLTANDQECNIVFGDPDNNDVGVIQYDHSDDSMKFTTGAAERMRVDANGNLLQGITTIPTGVQSSRQLISSSSTGAEIIAYRNDNAIAVDDFIGAFLIGHDDNSGTEDHFIGMWGEAASANGNLNLKFAAGRDTYETGGSHMMISSAGDLLVGTTASQGLVTIRPAGGGSSSVGYSVRPNTDTCTAVNFRNAAGTQIGHISITASETSYNTSSDQRLKENIADADDAGSKVDAIQVRKFDWKVDGSHQDYGMVAQELQTVAPEAVSSPEDPDEMMGVDYSKLVPMLIKEIQSLRARVNALEAE